MTSATRALFSRQQRTLLASRVGETEIALALLRVADRQPNGIATFRRLLVEVPKHLHLSPDDHTPAKDSPRRAHWEHVLRSIKLRAGEPGNIIREGYAERIPRVGYRITEAGRAYLDAISGS